MCQHARGRSIRLPLIREAEDRADSWVPIGLLIHAVWGALVSNGQFATNTNTFAWIEFGGTGILIGPTSCRPQPAPYAELQNRERDPLMPYGQPFMISANDGGCGRVRCGEMDTGPGPNSTPYTDIPGATAMDTSAHFAAVGQHPHVVLTLLPKNTNAVPADTRRDAQDACARE